MPEEFEIKLKGKSKSTPPKDVYDKAKKTKELRYMDIFGNTFDRHQAYRNLDLCNFRDGRSLNKPDISSCGRLNPKWLEIATAWQLAPYHLTVEFVQDVLHNWDGASPFYEVLTDAVAAHKSEQKIAAKKAQNKAARKARIGKSKYQATVENSKLMDTNGKPWDARKALWADEWADYVIIHSKKSRVVDWRKVTAAGLLNPYWARSADYDYRHKYGFNFRYCHVSNSSFAQYSADYKSTHKEDGPIIDSAGIARFYLHGYHYKDFKQWLRDTPHTFPEKEMALMVLTYA